MKDLTKKIMILAMVGMVQIGFSAAVSEASSFQHKVIHFDDRHEGIQDPNDPQLRPQPKPEEPQQPQPRPEQPQLQPQPEQPQQPQPQPETPWNQN